MIARSTLLVTLLIGFLISGCTLPLVWDRNPEPPSVTPSPIPKATATSPADMVATQPIPPTLTPTLVPSPSPTVVIPSPTPTALPDQYPFVLQTGSPQNISNFLHPDLGCNWLGVGGQVFGLDRQPNSQILIEFGGQLDGRQFKELILAGSAEATLGPGGFEFKLADSPVPSQGMVWAQLFDLAGEPVSNKVFFDTFEDCERNLIVLNFVELPDRESIRSFLPGISKSALFIP